MASDLAPEAQPFRLLDLPPELRNRIYELMVVPGEIMLRYSTTEELDPEGCLYQSEGSANSEGWPVDGPMLNICNVNRQVLTEVRPIFYSKTRFSIDVPSPIPKRNSVALAKRFLEDRPHVLGLIREFEFEVEESYYENGEGYLTGVEPGVFEELCHILATRCHLRYLRVEVWSWMLGNWLGYQESINILRQPVIPYDIPEWMFQLSVVKDLEELDVYFQHGSPHFARRNIAALKLLRSTMVNGGDALERMDGIKLQLMHPPNDNQNHQRVLCCELWIKNGHSELGQERRVRVHPYSWCKLCGMFLKRNGCDCSPDTGTDHCHVGSSGHYQLIAATDLEVSDSADIDRSSTYANRATVDLDHLYGYNIWDSRRWGGGPLKDFLPKGVTEKDFYYAKSLADGGVFIALPDYHHGKELAESDFGDTDSLLSLHWNDEEDRVEYQRSLL
ncbi:hypothetical protein BU25DRAFT_489378 [Macroventuria anomochaeta]|uniref:Uncharacterized protein n=1 Tax=Macroventuria anomochaeta TaxID=301207 RepID=A0ACB6S7J2_9PLEO|nr:uncharacterized protein BU25DRAFT_489378 [Macroventuria anomochaeta]KAF2629972.1 hypothetical protein BU25DRAFT_489378 [Macroventuria anomochaeta]